MSKALELADEYLWDDEHCAKVAAELRRLDAVEKELAAIRALEPVAWAFVDFWKAQDDPADDCFFIYERNGTVPLYALPEQK